MNTRTEFSVRIHATRSRVLHAMPDYPTQLLRKK